MALWEIVLIGAALSVDAFAAGMADAAIDSRMSVFKAAFIALTFAAFQFLMPVLGFYCGSAFSALVEKIAPWLSFVLLLFIGGKALFDYVAEQREINRFLHRTAKTRVSAGQILLQGVATSLDALAVGVTLLAEDVTGGLPVSIYFCSLLIGATTLCFSVISLELGKAVGVKFKDEAQFLGGAVLVFIGVKILLEGVLRRNDKVL